MSDLAVFERKETKYRIDARQHAAIRAALEGRMEPDAYGLVRVESLYFDTPERLLIARSLEKPLYKEKLRVRSYGRPEPDSCVFVEVKKKFRGIVYKRRVGMSHEAARAYLDGAPYEQACRNWPLSDARAQAASLAQRSLQIAREIDAFVARYAPLVPSMRIACNRVAYAPVSVDIPADLRITFDTDLAYADALNPQHPCGTLLDTGEAIMEIKARGAYPLWLAHALAQADIKPSSFSKYGAAYQACASKKGGRCA